MRYISKDVKKIDATALVTGKPVYTADMMPKECLVVKVLRSPHAYARIKTINKAVALKVPGIEAVYTYEDVPHIRFTMAGQSYPEPSPYDRYILEEYVRYVGDVVAIVAGESEEAVNKALKLIKVEYEVLEPVLDFTRALDHPTIIHPEEDYHTNFPLGGDRMRNLCASETMVHGDLEAAFAESDVIVENVYHTKANAQAMMETFRTYSYLDHNGRLTLVSSTQIPFHVRRHVARALGLPKTKVRVIKPRIGGGFGAKQTMVSEIYPAFVTQKTGKPAAMIFTREETFKASTSRHEMQIRVKVGSDKEGNIKAIDLYTLSNTGAYGEHASTVVGLSGHKTIPLYNKTKAFKFSYDVVYSNTMSAGAFRGYGATQGIFALESIMNELASKLGMDPVALRLKNIAQEGEIMPAYYNNRLESTALKECLLKGKELIGWDEKYPYKQVGKNKVRSVGMAMTMQGSAIADIDVATVEIRLGDDGFYTLMIGATDMGTGCDTILAQIAAECLDCELDKIVVPGVDTDISPFDAGSYASSTTYLTGQAVINTCEVLKEKMIKAAAKVLEVSEEEVIFTGDQFETSDGCKVLTLKDLGEGQAGGKISEYLSATKAHSSPTSPPPFMTGFVELEIDTETGEMEIIDYVGVVDCGTVINTSLARIQAEGGIVQGIGMALYEDIQYNAQGKMMNNSFMQYKIPSRLDVGKIRVAFESSYEPTGPFGAKSIGEIVINTPSPALAHAVYNGTGVAVRELPITPEKIVMGMLKQ